MKLKIGTAMLAVAIIATGSYAAIFGIGANQFTIDFVDIGNAGNAPDTSGYGSVGYNYQMGMHEVTIDQFAKARAADSRIGNGNENPYGGGANRAASDVSAYEAMKFSNWLTTGDAYAGAYQFDGSGLLQAVDRDAAVAAYGTVYVLPTEDEWYKAAYYKPVNDGSYSLYASGLDTVPVHGTANGWNYYKGDYAIGSPDYIWDSGFGAQEQNGTYDMMGNVWEWNESAWDGTLDNMSEYRVMRGGVLDATEYFLASSRRISNLPAVEGDTIGFRVAAIPEPSSALLLLVGSGGLIFCRRAKERSKTKIPSRRHFK